MLENIEKILKNSKQDGEQFGKNMRIRKEE